MLLDDFTWGWAAFERAISSSLVRAEPFIETEVIQRATGQILIYTHRSEQTVHYRSAESV